MNASRLREILDLLLDREKQFAVQESLNEVVQGLSELVAQPQDASIQSKFANTRERFRTANESLRNSFEPTQLPPLQELGAVDFFIQDFASDISASIRENPISPAVTQTKVASYAKTRRRYIDQITQLRDGLKALGIEPTALKSGDAEIGFLLPRALFSNHLDELIRKLRDVNRIIRAFSEATIGSVEEVEVREISASDPLFFFGIDPITIAAIGGAVTWALNTWKQIEDIRRVRAEVQKTKVLTEAEAHELFDKKISEKISTEVDAKLNDLVKDDGKPGRVKELRADLRWALESIMAYIERGMVVEVRFLPPEPAVPKGAPEGSVPTVPPEFQTLEAISQQLSFPKPEGAPILKIPAAPSPETRNE